MTPDELDKALAQLRQEEHELLNKLDLRRKDGAWPVSDSQARKMLVELTRRSQLCLEVAMETRASVQKLLEDLKRM